MWNAVQCNLNPPFAIATVSPIKSKIPKCINNDTLAIAVISDSLREQSQFKIQDRPEVLSDPTAGKRNMFFVTGLFPHERASL